MRRPFVFRKRERAGKDLKHRGPRNRALHPHSLVEKGKLQAPLCCVFAVSGRFVFARSVHCIGILRKCEGSDPFHARTARCRILKPAVKEGNYDAVYAALLCLTQGQNIV